MANVPNLARIGRQDMDRNFDAISAKLRAVQQGTTNVNHFTTINVKPGSEPVPQPYQVAQPLLTVSIGAGWLDPTGANQLYVTGTAISGQPLFGLKIPVVAPGYTVVLCCSFASDFRVMHMTSAPPGYAPVFVRSGGTFFQFVRPGSSIWLRWEPALAAWKVIGSWTT